MNEQRQISKLTGALTEHQHHFGKMSTEGRQWAIQNTEAAIGLFAEAVKNRSSELVVSKPAVLRFREEVSVGPLMSRVLQGSRTIKSADGGKLRSFDLMKNAYDRDIKAVLPENHEVELCQVEELIYAQKNGESGALLNNGRVNIFYVAGSVVEVHWDASHRVWGVNDCLLDRVHWHAVNRVFSRN